MTTTSCNHCTLLHARCRRTVFRKTLIYLSPFAHIRTKLTHTFKQTHITSAIRLEHVPRHLRVLSYRLVTISTQKVNRNRSTHLQFKRNCTYLHYSKPPMIIVFSLSKYPNILYFCFHTSLHHSSTRITNNIHCNQTARASHLTIFEGFLNICIDVIWRGGLIQIVRCLVQTTISMSSIPDSAISMH